ncbi:MAG: hypothetical protein ACXVBP_12465 [Flavisolibacter sp.]
MNWNAIIGVAATISLFLPAVAIVYYRLYQHRSLTALLLSYIITASYNLMSEGILPVPSGFLSRFGVINNYLDIPLTLTALLFFCPIRQKQRPVHLVTAAFVGYELVIACIYGLHSRAVVYIMGPGLVLILIYSFYLFLRHIKITVEFGKNVGRTLMLSAILFAYGCYALIYLFYYIQKTPAVADVFLLYFITALVSSIVMTIGLHLIRKRMKEFQEVKNTRRELAMFFGKG